MRFVLNFIPALAFMAILSSVCQAHRRRLGGHRRRRLASGGTQESTTFSGFTAHADVDWKKDSTCALVNHAFFTASDTTSKVGTDGKPQKSTYEDVYLTLTLLSQCTADSFVYTDIELSAYVQAALPDVNVTVDAQLNSGTITSKGVASVITYSCELFYDAEGDEYYYDQCGCTVVKSASERITMEAKLKGKGNAMPSMYTLTYRNTYGGYDYSYNGTTRDADIVSFSVKRRSGAVIRVPVSGASVAVYSPSLATATGGQTDYYSS
jgi:hypothetical protein